MQEIEQLNEQSYQLYSQGKYEEAIVIATKCLKLIRQNVGNQHPDVALGLNNLAELYRAMGNCEKAEPLYLKALDVWRIAFGEQHPDFAFGLNNLATLYLSMGKFTEAESLCCQAMEIRRNVLGEKHPDFALSLNNLAMFYSFIGNYEKAKPLHEQAVTIWRSTLGEKHPNYAGSLNNLATLYLSMGKFTEAESLCCQAMEIRRNVLGEKHPDFTNSLNNLAELYRLMGNYRKAESLHCQTMEIRRSVLGEKHPDFANSLNNLAVLYSFIGNYKQAEPLYCQAAEIYRVVFGKQHPNYATGLNNLAELYRLMGNYRKAESLYRQAMEIRRSVLDEKHPDYANSLNNLALLYHLMGRYKQAEPLYCQAIEIYHVALGKEHPLFVSSLNNLAGFYLSIGNYRKAEPLYHQAIEVYRIAFGEQHPNYATGLNNLAGFYHSAGNYEKAESLCSQAMEIKRNVLGELHSEVADNLNNLAMLHRLIGNYEKAESLCFQAMEIGRNAVGEKHPCYANSLNNLARLYHSTGNYEKAEPLYHQAIEVNRIAFGEQHPNYAIGLGNLAALCIAKSRVLEGFKLIEQTKVIEDKLIGQVFSISSETQRAAYLENVEWDTYLSLVSRYLFNLPNVVRSAFDLVLRRKAIEAEVLASQRDLVVGGRYPKLEPTLRKVTVIRNQIAQRILAGPGKEGLEDHQQFLAEWNLEKEKLETQLAKQIPEINLEQKFREVDIRSIAMAMPEKSILIEFVRFDVADFKAIPARGEQEWKPARYLAFTLVAREPDSIQMIDLGEAEPIDNLIAAFRTSITGEFENQSSRNLRLIKESPQREYSDVGVELRKTIFDPLISAIGNRKRLLFSPDGDLTRLPFEVLPINDKHLIDLYEISYLAAGRDLLRFGIKSNRRTADPLVIADPDFDLSDANRIDTSKSAVTLDLILATKNRGRLSRDFNRSDLVFTRLQGTKEEGKTIASMLGVEPLLESNALESKLKACKSPRILHIATHGFFLPGQKRDPNQENRVFGTMGFDAIGAKGGINRLTGTNPENPLLRSGLALAGANTWMKNQDLPVEAEDGILTAEDVTGLDLLDTELVVLSACETGLGEVRAGEGVFGLRRAFVLAGAKTLVMSLWKVPDIETQEIMTSFYEKILRGEPRGEALRQAQLEMKDKNPNPFFWGAFICQGETSPLEINVKENAL